MLSSTFCKVRDLDFFGSTFTSLFISLVNLCIVSLYCAKTPPPEAGALYSVTDVDFVRIVRCLNSHYFHIIGDGHQPNSRGLYTHYKDSLLKVG